MVSRRRGRSFIDVPVPVRRNKRDILGVQSLFSAIRHRSERQLSDRIFLELDALTAQPRYATPIRARSAQFEKIYKERIHMFRR